MRVGSLFSGYGGLDMAVCDVLGASVAWHSEIDKDASAILAHHWPNVPNHGDLTAIDWPRVEPVDVLTGGFPCQDLSHAGKRAGLRPDTRSGLWSHMAYAIDQLRPRLVVAENVRGLLSAEAHSDVEPCPWCLGDGEDVSAVRALGAVLADLAALGYDTRVCGLRAADVGAPHNRFRVFVAATDTRGQRHGRGQDRRSVGRVDSEDAGEAWERQRAWEVAEHRGSATSHAGNSARVGGGSPRQACSESQGANGASGTGQLAAADAADVGHERGGATRVGGGGPEDGCRPVATDTDVPRLERRHTGSGGGTERATRPSGVVDWGQYAAAVNRWGHTIGRPAPAPTEPGRNGKPRLSPRFVEWMMGLPAGHVTDVPISRNAQLKALGNGVVPQHAAAALRYLLSVEAVAA